MAVHWSGSVTSVCTARALRPAASTSAFVSSSRSIAAGTEDHVGTGLGEALGDGDTEPGGGAGDQGHLAVEAEAVERGRHGVSFEVGGGADVLHASCRTASQVLPGGSLGR